MECTPCCMIPFKEERKMRIGELAQRTKVSVDTIRYYAKEGLLEYEKCGKNWEFDESQISLVESIIMLRNLNFSINEINFVFHASEELLDNHMVDQEKVKSYKSFFENKIIEINKQKSQIELAEKKILKIIQKLEILEGMEDFEL